MQSMENIGRALIVDDDAGAVEVLSLFIAELGFALVTAANGHEALEKCADTKFAVVVTDLVMPGVGGIEFVRRLRLIDPDVPVLMVTGQPSNPSLAMATDLGVCEYIVKPFSGEDLKRRILLALKAQRARQNDARTLPD